MSTSTHASMSTGIGLHEEATRTAQQTGLRRSAYRRPRARGRRPTNVARDERLWSVGTGAALGAYGLLRGRASGIVLTAIGAGLIYRGMTGHCYAYEALGVNTAEQGSATAVPAQDGYKVERSITIGRPPAEIYQHWRNLEDLPRFMQHLKSVEERDPIHSHWVARGALGKDLEWDAEIINERENELLAWRSLPGGDVDTAGSLRLHPLSHGRGTEVTVTMKYNPPAGKIGAHVASWFGDGLERKLDDDLRRFKQILEAGEVATTLGQPHGPASRR